MVNCKASYVFFGSESHEYVIIIWELLKLCDVTKRLRIYVVMHRQIRVVQLLLGEEDLQYFNFWLVNIKESVCFLLFTKKVRILLRKNRLSVIERFEEGLYEGESEATREKILRPITTGVLEYIWISG
jgi:hypothetical protein